MTTPDPLPTDDPALPPEPELFIGREGLFSWLSEHLGQGVPRPLLIIGPPQIGKTAVLQQIRNGRLGPGFLPLYVDLNHLQHGSLSIFLHDLAQTAVPQLQSAGISLPQPEQSDFVVNPHKAFQEQFLHPVLARLEGRKLLLLGDNLDTLLGQMARQSFAGYTFENIYRLFHDQANVCTLFTLTQPDASGQVIDLAPFAAIPKWELGPLTPDEAAAYLRHPTPVTMLKDVTDYIYQVSGGRPAELQKLRQCLVDWKAQYDIRRLTVADVAAARQAMEATAVIRPMPTPFLIARPAPPERADYRSPYRAMQVGRSALLLGSALFLLAVALLTSAILFRAQAGSSDSSPPPEAAETAVRLTSEALAAAIIAQTPTVTPTPNPTATATPSDTPAPSPTATSTATPRPTRTPTPESLSDTRLREIDAMPMRLIPAGTFMMGAGPDDLLAASDERPLHRVILNDFYIDQYEVSVAQYAAFLNRLGTYRQACNGFDCAMPRERVGVTSYLLEEEMGTSSVLYTPLTGFANYPANFISWHGAAAYCAAVGGRLPTEAEWEYAARGDDGRLYPWGNEAPNELRAVFNSNFDNLKPVNALPAGQSPFGIFGLAGGVWEWVADWYDEDYYAISPELNPTGPELGLTRSIRGGAWPLNNEADRIRSANRSSAPPETTSASIGFRCAQDP